MIFSERLETLAFLAQHLRTDLRLPERAIGTLHGGLSDIEQQRLVEEFAKVSSPLRLLLCSDVASEGLNLHYLCHRLIHFDLPWSLMLFQQRNGRVDRYGQKHQPHITYLVTESGNERIRGDQRILDVLQVKDEQAYRNIGDPSVFMHVHDPDAEVRITEEAMASGMTAPAFDAKYQPRPDEGEDLLAQFLAVMNEPAPGAPVRTPQDSIAVSPGLFAGDYTYCKAALEYLSRSGSIAQWQAHDAERRIALTAPPDLAARLRQVPREAIPELQQFVLTDDKAQVMAEMERSWREAGDSEETWPRIQYLWKQHPVVQWLTDRVQASFGRHKAPVVLFPKLGPEEALVVISGLVPNRRGQPIVYEWLAVLFSSGQFTGIEPFVEFVKASGIGRTPLTNPGKAIDTTALQLLVPAAVAAARDELLRRRAHFESTMSAKLAAQTCELGRLRQRQFDQVERRLASSAQAQAFKDALRARRAKEINEVFDAFTVWVEDTMTTEPLPYLQVVAMFAGAGASR